MSDIQSNCARDGTQHQGNASRLSAHLPALDTGTDTTVGAIVDSLGSQAFGATMFVFAAPNLIPNPPGTSPILGLPLIFLTVQLVLGRKTLCLPEVIRGRTVSHKFIASFTGRTTPVLAWVEKLLRPRYSFLAGTEFATRLIGIVTFPLALILLLPLPFLHMLPGAAMACFALALAERDGLAAVAGYILAATSVAVTLALALAAQTGIGFVFQSFANS